MRWAKFLSIASLLTTGCSLIGTSDLRADGEGGDGAGGAPASTTSGSGATASTGGEGGTCGNGIVETGEACDGSLNGHDCTEIGYVNPEGASCMVACAVSYAGCTASCGNDTVEPGEECDGGPGCSNMCTSTSAGTCADPIANTMTFGGLSLTGVTEGQTMETTQRCGGNGPERVYAISAMSTGFLTATVTATSLGWNPLVSVRRSCAIDDEIACHDNPASKPDVVSVHVQAGERLYLLVDSAQNQPGTFALEITLTRGTCDDPVPILMAQPEFSPLKLYGTTTGQPSMHQGSCGGPGSEVVYRFLPVSGQVVAEITGTKLGGGNQAPTLYLRSSCVQNQSEFDCDSLSLTNVSTFGNANVFLFVDSPVSTFGEYVLDVGFDFD